MLDRQGPMTLDQWSSAPGRGSAVCRKTAPVGLYTYGLRTYDLYSYGLFGYGLYGYGLYSYAWPV